MDNIPQIRGSAALHATNTVAVVTLAVAVCVSSTPTVYYAVVSTCTATLLVVLSEVLHRFCLLCEEHKHVKSRYDGDYRRVLKGAFATDWKNVAVVITCAFVLVVVMSGANANPLRLWFDGGIASVTFTFVGVLLLLRNIKPWDVLQGIPFVCHFVGSAITISPEMSHEESLSQTLKMLVAEVTEMRHSLQFLREHMQILHSDNKELMRLLKHEREKNRNLLEKYEIDETNKTVDSESESPLQTSILIRDMGGLDYGAGMAYSYFYGYFKLILPKSGTELKNVRENMGIYEDRHVITFATYKLLILIPLSLYCPVSLKNENNPEIEEAESLDKIIITVAGVRNRVYCNPVYKIRTDDGIKYVCAEYATPLKTFRDVLLHNTEHANYYKKHQKELVLQFYLTLRQILQENIDCTDYCELIFFDDMHEDRRTYKNIAPILLDRIDEINRRL